MQYWQSGLNLQKTHYSLSLINHVYYYHPLFSMDVLTNTWTGNLVKVVIPRPDPSGAPVAGVGKVFLEYADVEGSTKAKTGMHGRKFGGNQVVAVFYPEDKFHAEQYDG